MMKKINKPSQLPYLCKKNQTFREKHASKLFVTSKNIHETSSLQEVLATFESSGLGSKNFSTNDSK